MNDNFAIDPQNLTSNKEGKEKKMLDTLTTRTELFNNEECQEILAALLKAEPNESFEIIRRINLTQTEPAKQLSIYLGKSRELYEKALDIALGKKKEEPKEKLTLDDYATISLALEMLLKGMASKGQSQKDIQSITETYNKINRMARGG